MTTTASPKPTRSVTAGWISGTWSRPGAQLTGLVVLLIVFGVLRSPDFLTEINLYSLMQPLTPSLIVGLFASLALYAGIADLSIGSVVGVSAIAFAVAQEHGLAPILAMAVALGSGLVVGALNGIAVVSCNADPLVVTLGTLAALRGVVYTIGGNESKVAIAPSLENVVSQRVGAVPIMFAVLVVLFAVVAFLISRARVGRHIQATGGDRDAALRSGIPARRIERGLLLLTAGGAALAGLIYVGLLDSAPITLGSGMELQIYAAILISGFSLTNGGVGNPMVTVAGLIALALISNLLALASINPAWQDVVTGALLAVAVALDVARRRERFD